LKGSYTGVGRTLALLGLSVAALVGCGGGSEAGGGQATSGPGVSPDTQLLGDEVQNLVDKGNTAQRAGEYSQALEYYRQAMKLAWDHPVPQFGALMAAVALGDSSLADSLRAKLEVTGPDLLAMVSPGGAMAGSAGSNPHGAMGGATPPASGGADTGALPPGHPPVSRARPDTVRPDTGGIG
jgi:hypothetical protein